MHRLLPLLAAAALTITGCDSGESAVVANADSGEGQSGEGIIIDVLRNDTGTALSIESFQSQSANGGTVTKTASERLAYRSRNGFQGGDTFTYTARNGEGEVSDPATVTILIRR